MTKRLENSRSVFVLFLFFLIYLLCFALPEGAKTKLSLWKGDPSCNAKVAEVLYSCRSPKAATPLTTVDDLITIYGFNDQASYAARAKKIVAGTFSHSDALAQPPGLAVVEAVLLSISNGFPLGFGLVGIICVLWALSFTLMSTEIFIATNSYIISVILPLTVSFLPSFREETGFGVWLSDAYATALLILGICLLVRGSHLSRRYVFAALSGLALAASGYMRAQMDINALIATLILVAVYLFFVILRLFSSKTQIPKGFLKAAPMLLVALLTYHFTTFPYRLWNGGQWVTASGFDNVWTMIWDRPDELPPEWAFFAQGGGTAGCFADQVRCNYIHECRRNGGMSLDTSFYRQMTLISIVEHPLSWVRYKASRLWWGWNYYRDGLPLVVLIVALTILLLQCPVTSAVIVGFWFSTMLIATLAPLLFLHLEVRYLDPFKILTVVGFILMVANRPRLKRSCMRPTLAES